VALAWSALANSGRSGHRRAVLQAVEDARAARAEGGAAMLRIGCASWRAHHA
jgi:hypothetical protein